MPPKKDVKKILKKVCNTENNTDETTKNKRVITQNSAMALGIAKITCSSETLLRNGVLNKSTVTGNLNFPEQGQKSDSQKNAVELDFSNMLGVEGFNLKFKLEVSSDKLRKYARKFIQSCDVTHDNVGKETNNNEMGPENNRNKQPNFKDDTNGRLSMSCNKGADKSSTSSISTSSFEEIRKKNYVLVKKVNTSNSNSISSSKEQHSQIGVVLQKPIILEQREFRHETNHNVSTGQPNNNNIETPGTNCLPSVDKEINNKQNGEKNNNTDNKIPDKLIYYASKLLKSGVVITPSSTNSQNIKKTIHMSTMTENQDEIMASSSTNSDVSITVSNDNTLTQPSDETVLNNNNEVREPPKKKINSSDAINHSVLVNNNTVTKTQHNNKNSKKIIRNPFKKNPKLIPRKGIKGNSRINNAKNKVLKSITSMPANILSPISLDHMQAQILNQNSLLMSNQAGNHNVPQNLSLPSSTLVPDTISTDDNCRYNSGNCLSTARSKFNHGMVAKINHEVNARDRRSGDQSVILQPHAEGSSDHLSSDRHGSDANIEPMEIKTETSEMSDTLDQSSIIENRMEINQQIDDYDCVDLTLDEDEIAEILR